MCEFLVDVVHVPSYTLADSRRCEVQRRNICNLLVKTEFIENAKNLNQNPTICEKVETLRNEKDDELYE